MLDKTSRWTTLPRPLPVPWRPGWHLLILLGCTLFGCRADGLAGSNIINRPGTEVTRSRDGDSEITELKRNGVTIREIRRGDRTQRVGVDNSGHGAVLCLWKIYIAARADLDICSPDVHPDLRSDLDAGISAMNEFIVANDIVPNTRERVEGEVVRESNRLSEAARKFPADRLAKTCAPANLKTLTYGLSEKSHAQRQAMIADLLSVPRPPVVNPCL